MKQDNRMEQLNKILNPDSIIQEAEVDTWRYEAAHGKKPRGSGGWFFTTSNKDIDFLKDKEGKDYIQIQGNFTKAWKEAAKKLGVAIVWVQS